MTENIVEIIGTTEVVSKESIRLVVLEAFCLGLLAGFSLGGLIGMFMR